MYHWCQILARGVAILLWKAKVTTDLNFESSSWQSIKEDLSVQLKRSYVAPTSSFWCTGWNLLVRQAPLSRHSGFHREGPPHIGKGAVVLFKVTPKGYHTISTTSISSSITEGLVLWVPQSFDIVILLQSTCIANLYKLFSILCGHYTF